MLRSGVPISHLPLDVTHKATITTPRMDVLRQQPNANGSRLAGICQATSASTRKNSASKAALHDPCAIAYAVFPEFFSGRECHVAVETQSELTMGACVVDWWGTTANRPMRIG